MGGVVSGITDIMGGQEASEDLQKSLQQSMALQKQYLGQAQGYMQPFYGAGQDALKQLQGMFSQMQDPQKFYQQMMSGYQTSPQAQLQMSQAQKAANQSAAASGMLGSGAEQKGLAGYAQQLTSADQQQWLNNMMGIHSQAIQGLGGLEQQGFGAGGQMGGWGMKTGSNLSDLMQQMGMAQAQGDKSMWSGIGEIAGGIGSFAGIPGFPTIPGSGGGGSSGASSGGGLSPGSGYSDFMKYAKQIFGNI